MVTQIGNVNQSINEGLSQLLAKSPNQGQTTKLDTSYLSASTNSVTISTLAKDVGNFYAQITTLEDSQSKSQALNGLNQFISQVSNDFDPIKSISVTNSLKQTSNSDPELMTGFFQTIDSLNVSGNGADDFIDLFSSLNAADSQKILTSGVNNILQSSLSGYEASSQLSLLFSTARSQLTFN